MAVTSILLEDTLCFLEEGEYLFLKYLSIIFAMSQKHTDINRVEKY